MPVKDATRVAGAFLDFRELAADGPVLAMIRIREFMPAEPDKFKRNTYPVVADVLICDGPREGEVYPGEVIKYAPSNVLRGISTAESDKGAAPVNEVTDEIRVRINVVKKDGSQPFVGFDIPSTTEKAQIDRVHADGAGWAGKSTATNGAPAPAAEGAPAAKPWR